MTPDQDDDRNFSFVLPGRLAGMSCPGKYGDLDGDLAWIRDQGIGGIVTLLERPLPQQSVLAPDRLLHLYTPNMEPPMMKHMPRLLRFVDGILAESQAVAVHCAYGHGRTGTALACLLLHLKEAEDAAAAIARVRELRPGSIESRAQEDFVASFAQQYGG